MIFKQQNQKNFPEEFFFSKKKIEKNKHFQKIFVKKMFFGKNLSIQWTPRFNF